MREEVRSGGGIEKAAAPTSGRTMPVATEAPASSTLRFMTYNVRHPDDDDTAAGRGWLERREFVLSMIEREHPDVLGVQELTGNRRHHEVRPVRFLRAELELRGYRYIQGVGGSPKDIFYDASRLEPPARATSSGVFYLPPNRRSPCRQDGFWKRGSSRSATWALLRERDTGHEFVVVNTHLSHRGEDEPERIAQLRCVRTVIGSIAQGRPVVVMGDLNATDRHPSLCELLAPPDGSLRLFDTHAGAPGGTFNGFCSTCEPKRKIDFILARGFTVTEPSRVGLERIDGHWPSDHCPVIVGLQMTADPTALDPVPVHCSTSAAPTNGT